MENFILSKSISRLRLSFLLLLLLCSLSLVKAQIIVETGAYRANFGVDADVQTESTFTIFENGILQPLNGFPGSDDWFDNIDPFGNGRGVIDVSLPLPDLSNNNNTFTRGMSEDFFYLDPVSNTRWLDAVYIRDPNWAGNNKDFSIFKGQSNKNADNPLTWNTITGSNPQKNDLIDALGHLRREGPGFNDSLWAFIGASTRSEDGSAYLDFELFRSEIMYDSNTNELSNTGDPTKGGHTEWVFDSVNGRVVTLGDVIISLNFENGGVVIDGHLYIWIKPSELPGGSIQAYNNLILGFNDPANYKFKFVIGGNGQPVFESGDDTNGYGYAEIELYDDNALPVTFANINGPNANGNGDVPAGPIGTIIGSQGNVTDTHFANTFVEFGINFSAFGFDQSLSQGECEALFGGVIIKTRSSPSFTSELKDFAGPFPFGNIEESSVDIVAGEFDCVTDTVTLTAQTNVTEGLVYEWYICEQVGEDTDGNLICNGDLIPLLDSEGNQFTSQSITVDTSGNYAVVVIAPGFGGPGTGCSSQDIIFVEIENIDPPTVNCPENLELDSCQTQAQIDAAYSDWIAQFSFSGGKNPVGVYTIDGVEIDISTYTPNQFACEGGSVTINLVVTDDCEETVSCESSFSVAKDEESPTWSTADNALDVTLECDDATGLAEAQALFPVAMDNCDMDVSDIEKVSGDYIPSSECPQSGSYTNTWTVTDDCGNVSAVYTQVITIVDTTAPTWSTADNALDVTLECDDATGLAEAQALFPVAMDNCDMDV
ncbi:hypothetical protein DFQ05_2492, partial [Winogradskyella wandonensis]